MSIDFQIIKRVIEESKLTFQQSTTLLQELLIVVRRPFDVVMPRLAEIPIGQKSKALYYGGPVTAEELRKEEMDVLIAHRKSQE